ncbi:unnamed protein product [Protopolystoma xenopodis]|uniref:Secreted protein n=1 Tax=Protopolystoma xenopodis TaxID=117903 RepID=A0A448WFV8_9PLAT|nr:unnamed protein product [Protopolystoma xenopodis]
MPLLSTPVYFVLFLGLSRLLYLAPKAGELCEKNILNAYLAQIALNSTDGLRFGRVSTWSRVFNLQFTPGLGKGQTRGLSNVLPCRRTNDCCAGGRVVFTAVSFGPAIRMSVCQIDFGPDIQDSTLRSSPGIGLLHRSHTPRFDWGSVRLFVLLTGKPTPYQLIEITEMTSPDIRSRWNQSFNIFRRIPTSNCNSDGIAMGF